MAVAVAASDACGNSDAVPRWFCVENYFYWQKNDKKILNRIQIYGFLLSNKGAIFAKIITASKNPIIGFLQCEKIFKIELSIWARNHWERLWRKKMQINLDIDDKLLNLAIKVGKQKSKQDVVNEALQEYILKRKRFEITKIFGQVEYEENYDYKAQRNIQ